MLHPDELRGADIETFAEANINACSYQPIFASAEAAEPWQVGHPGSRTFTVKEMFERSWYAYYRDLLRPRIYPVDGR